jgi:uncharacterized protein YPO0396
MLVAFACSKSIQVEKLVPVEFDLNLLAAFDSNAIDAQKLRFVFHINVINSTMNPITDGLFRTALRRKST